MDICLFFGWFIKDCYCSFQWKWMFVVYFLVGLLKIVIFLFSGNGCLLFIFWLVY